MSARGLKRCVVVAALWALAACSPEAKAPASATAGGALTQDALEEVVSNTPVAPEAPARTLLVYRSLSTQVSVDGVSQLFADRDLMTALVEAREGAFWEASTPDCKGVEGWTVCVFCDVRERKLADGSARIEVGLLEGMHIPLSSPDTGELWRFKAIEQAGGDAFPLADVQTARSWCEARGYAGLSPLSGEAQP